MSQEERAKGAVGLDHYWEYLKAGGIVFFLVVVLSLFVLAQAATTLNMAWITFWTEDTFEESLAFYLVGYALTAVLIGVFSYFRGVAMAKISLQASTSLHDQLLRSILKAPMSFFDTTPLGRIISRFSKDMYALDNDVVRSYTFFLFTVLMVIFTFVTIIFSTPIFVVALIPVMAVYMYVLRLYRPVSRDIKRLESISRSPVYSHFQETLNGLATIRAYDSTPEFLVANATQVDFNIICWYHAKFVERWLSVILELMGSSLAVVVAILVRYPTALQDFDRF
jgi:ABC-type multidrug transport system fused ATPase/permease subunit